MTSPSYIPRVPISSHVPSLYSLKLPKQAKLQVMTDMVLHKYLFPQELKNKTDVIAVAILGRRGSGKTVLLRSLAALGFDQYGMNNFNVVWTDDLSVAIKGFDSKDVQMLLIDDAMTKQSSRRIHANTDKLGDYNNIRHIYEKVTGKTKGLIIVVFAWQRWMDLDPAIKDSLDVIFLKTASYAREKDMMIEMFGKDYYRYIAENYDLIRQGDDNAKSRSIVHVVSLDGTGNENGVFILDKLECPNMPEFIDTSIIDNGEEEQNRGEQTITLEDLLASDDEKIRIKARCYEMLYIKGSDCRKTGLALGISHSSASRYANDIRNLLESKEASA
ncbi:hypothetical protein [Candidatus Methanomassiliicoccus intestinalis]|uniref:hypothetical protein n=1 Tax=Candidatus Methanomassiliicoccus intestinalis TaxID=1406512 RepID=UPI0037DC6FE3